MDRNALWTFSTWPTRPSLSARRAWIEIPPHVHNHTRRRVALRKESVDRNLPVTVMRSLRPVALRKESVDRNRYVFGNAD